MSTSSTPSSTGSSVPRVGGVRCYWALLQPRYVDSTKLELKFVHLDPVLSVHMAKQKMSMMGRGLIEFIHPNEREQARRDLASAVESNDLTGSVTRVRFARLSRIRTILGCPPEENDFPYDAAAYVEDDEWMILDLVLNWVADGLILAFFHAIKDIDPVANNDPARTHEGWSNFCGTAYMPEEQIEALNQNILANIPLPQPSRLPPARVFQIHTPEALIFSWPPPRTHPSTRDGSYDADEYSNLMKGVDMDPSQLQSGEVRTSCTTRFGAKHSITSEGIYRHVTSVFIPYGSLIFACFLTTKNFELRSESREKRTREQYEGYPSIAQVPYASPHPHPRPHPHSHPQPHPQQQSQPRSHSPSSVPLPLQSSLPSSYPSLPTPFHPVPPPLYPYNQLPPPPTIPPPILTSSAPDSPPSGRPLVSPPGDTDCCRACGTRESPEWRKSENGVKDLCNACGLRLARAQAKKEGRQKPRKKK